MRDALNGFDVIPALDFDDYQASANGHIIDLRGYDSATFAVHSHTITNAGPLHYFRVTIDHGDQVDLSDAVAVTTATGQLGAALLIDSPNHANSCGTIGYAGGKRYIRLVLTEVVTSGTAHASLAATCWLGKSAIEPVNTEAI